MRPSRYVITYREVRRGEHVLYDVVGDRYVGVDDAGLAAISRWGESAPRPGDEAACASSLAEMGFLVEDAEGDRARLAAARARAAEGHPGTLHVTLMPTLACDLACGYCFQKDHPATGHMRPEVESAALDWIARRAGAEGVRRLTVLYLGGEPLVRKDFVLRTAVRLGAAMRRRGLGFSWEITTNGVSLEVPFARAMAALGPGSIKLTLDGDRETHDQSRVYRSGRGTFDRVFAALVSVARACPEIRLRVGGNVRAGQEASCERLLARLEGAGLAGRLEHVRFKPVVEEGACAGACGSAAAEQALVQLGRSAASRGLSRVAARGVDEIAPCELHWEHAFVIDPAGRLYKCVAVAGRPEMALGSVREGALGADPLTAGEPWEACGADCPFVPICMGGCLGGAYAVGGRLGRPACERASLEARFRDEITRRYLEEFPTEAASQAA